MKMVHEKYIFYSMTLLNIDDHLLKVTLKIPLQFVKLQQFSTIRHSWLHEKRYSKQWKKNKIKL